VTSNNPIRTFLVTFIIFLSLRSRLPDQRGVITHAHHRHVDASKERFQHAQRRACFETVFGSKFPRFVMTAAEATNLSLLFWLNRFFELPE
jgi:hypothetical protein